MKKLLLIVAMLTSVSAVAQTSDEGDNQKTSHFTASLELQTKYMWRGIEYGTAPTLLPSLSYSIAGFSVYGMGGYAWNGSHQEVDMGVSYTLAGFTLGVNDYFYPSAVGAGDDYFNYKGKETGHWFEGSLSYYPEKIPVWVLVSTYFAGADRNTTTGKQAWSSYAEIGGQYDFKNDMYINLAVGAALNKSFYNDYEHGFGVCNIALKYGKNFEFGKFTVPLSVSYIINPVKEKTFVTFSAGISF